jgi:hypothetical protein
VIKPSDAWSINSGNLTAIEKKGNEIRISFEKGQMNLGADSIEFSNIKISRAVSETNMFTVSKKGVGTVLSAKERYPIVEDGTAFSDFYPRLPFALKHRIERYKSPIVIVLLVMLSLTFLLFRNKIRTKHVLVGLAILLSFLGIYLAGQSNIKYFISQTEHDALSVLSRFPAGTVLVYDKDCLRCVFSTQYKPAAAAGIKNYVGKYSKKPIAVDFEFQTAATSVIAREVLKEKSVKYVYLPRYEGYIESLPYDAADLGLKRIYENANAQIWQVL